MLSAGCPEDEGAGLVVVFRALFPGGKAGEDDGSALEAFGSVNGVTGDGVARCWVLNVGFWILGADEDIGVPIVDGEFWMVNDELNSEFGECWLPTGTAAFRWGMVD